MPTTNYTFNELYGAGTSSIDLTAGTQYTFTITNNSGSSYFAMETVPNQNGVYDSSSPKNLSGSFTSVTNITTAITSSNYVAGFSLPTSANEFIFTPTFNVTGSTLKLRGTGGIILGITPGSFITPYSLFFNSTTAYAQLSPGITIGGTYQQPFTVEGWFKSNNPGINSGPVFLSTSTSSSDPSYLRALTVNVAASDRIMVDSNGANSHPFTFGETMLPDTWYYFAVSRNDSGNMQAWLGKEGNTTASASISGVYDCSIDVTSWALTGISDTIGRFIPANRDSELDYISGVRVTTTNLYTTTNATIPMPTQTFNYVEGIEFLLGATQSIDLTGNNTIAFNGDISFGDVGPDIEVVDYI